MELSDWQATVNKPVFSKDGKHIGVVREVQPQKFMVTFGPITPDKYVIPKASVERFQDGVVYLTETGGYVEDNYKYE